MCGQHLASVHVFADGRLGTFAARGARRGGEGRTHLRKGAQRGLLQDEADVRMRDEDASGVTT